MRLGTTELKKTWFVFPGFIWGKRGEGVVRLCFLVYVCGVVLDDLANGGCVVVLVVSSRMVSMVLVLLGVGPILGNG